MAKGKKFMEPPLLKGFFREKEATLARKDGQILLSRIYLYPECENECIQCCYGHKKELPDELTILEYKSLLEEVAELGVKTVFVPGMGEPLLRDGGQAFLQFARTANDLGIYVGLISSLNPLPSHEVIREIKSLDVSIIAKLESMIPDVFNQIVNPKEPYKFVSRDRGYVTEGLDILLKEGFAEENRLGCGTVINSFNQTEIPNIFRFYRENNIFPYLQMVSPFGRAKERPDLWAGVNNRQIYDELRQIDQTEFGYDWKPDSHWVAFYFNPPCFIVEYDGTVRHDPAFLVELGNVKEDGEFKPGLLKDAVPLK